MDPRWGWPCPHPERVAALILVAPGLPDYPWPLEASRFWREFARSTEAADRDALVKPRPADLGPGGRRRRGPEPGDQAAISTFLAARGPGGGGAPPPRHPTGSARSGRPTAVVRGDREYPMVADCSDRDRGAAFPAARQFVIPGADHMLPLRVPGRLAEIIAGHAPSRVRVSRCSRRNRRSSAHFPPCPAVTRNTSRNSASRASRCTCWSTATDRLPSRTASAAAARTASSAAAARASAIAVGVGGNRVVEPFPAGGQLIVERPGTPAARVHRRTRPSASDPLTRIRSGRRLSAGSKGSLAGPPLPRDEDGIEAEPHGDARVDGGEPFAGHGEPGLGRRVQNQRHDAVVRSPRDDQQQVDQSPPGDPRRVAVEPPPAAVRPRAAEPRRPGHRAAERDAPAHLAPAGRAEPPVAQRGLARPSAASVMTRPRCCSQTNVVARQPLASSSTTAQ